jgi:hypothetical protein
MNSDGATPGDISCRTLPGKRDALSLTTARAGSSKPILYQMALSGAWVTMPTIDFIPRRCDCKRCPPNKRCRHAPRRQIIRVNDTLNAAITGSNTVNVTKAGLLPFALDLGGSVALGCGRLPNTERGCRLPADVRKTQ